jgi:hypothetical protein
MPDDIMPAAGRKCQPPARDTFPIHGGFVVDSTAMNTQSLSKRGIVGLTVVALALGLLAGAVASRAAAEKEDRVSLFNGKDVTGWKLRNATAETKETWKVVSKLELDAKNPGNLVGSGEGGTADSALFRQAVKHGSDIITEQSFGDCELHIEFMVAKGTNSGVYLMGAYEIQVLDSFGRADERMSPGDCGGIYNTKAPSVNASKAPGEWQSFDVVFRAPRFGPDGKKTENAKFVSLIYNGKKIHENVEVKGGTGGQLGPEKPTGPIMLQGDHGIVGYRNITIKPIEAK